MNINVANVSALIHFMDGLSAPDFTMARFINYKDGCGTPACALGWACTLPELKDAGLNLETLSCHIIGETSNMAELVFGHYYELFNSGLSLTIHTPQQWSAHARAFLRKHGHEVAPITTAQTDHFNQFMSRVLAPRPELQGLPSEITED